MNERLYCTTSELAGDLTGVSESDINLTRYISGASQFIERRLGIFLPVTATRKFDGEGKPSIQVPGLLTPATITYDGTPWTTNQYNLYPLNRCWMNGPYTRIEAYLTAFAAYPGILNILGTWGLYDEKVSIGLSATQTLAATTLALTDMPCLAVGMTLLIETEQEQITSLGSVASGTRTYGVRRACSGTIAAAHNAAVVYQQLPPADVNWLCRQIAGLMRSKAASGFAGKTGNAELGETFYFNEFPSQIKEVRKNYRMVSI